MKKIRQYCFRISLATLALVGVAGGANAQEASEKFFQKYKFVNMTEFGALFGRIKYSQSYGWYPYLGSYPVTTQVRKRINMSAQTFNGVYLNKKTAAGITVGVDGYGETILMPVALGIRRSLIQKREGGSSLVAGLDAGYATTWLNEDNTGFKTTGGLIVNPTIGYRLPMRSGSAWLINVGYRFQKAEYRQERGEGVYWSESTEIRNYKRITLRFGVEF